MINPIPLRHGSRAAATDTVRAAQMPERLISHVTPAEREDALVRWSLLAAKVALPWLGAYLLLS